MSSNTTSFKGLLVGNVGRKVEHTPGHLKFTVKWEASHTDGQTRTDISKFVLCHMYGPKADVMAKYVKPGIKGNFIGEIGDPATWTLGDGTTKAANTILLADIQIHEYREQEKIADLQRQLAEMADKLNKAEDSLRSQAAMIANAARTPDELPIQMVQERIIWKDVTSDNLPIIPSGDPEPPALEIVEDEGEPMPAF